MQNEAVPLTRSSKSVSYEVKVGLTVRAVRNFFGLSQTELAQLTGVSRPTLSILEKGNTGRHANSETLEKLLDYFRSVGVSIAFDGNELVYTFSEEAVRRASGKS